MIIFNSNFDLQNYYFNLSFCYVMNFNKMNINPLIILISQIISLYNFVLIIYCVAGWLINFNVLNRDNKFVSKLMITFGKIIEPVLNKVRRFIPDLGNVDISPIIVFLLLNFVRNILFTYFYVK